MAVEEHKKNDEAAIQGLLDDCIRSLHDKNIEGIMSLYAPEVVSFDIVPELAIRGSRCIQKRFGLPDALAALAFCRWRKLRTLEIEPQDRPCGPEAVIR